MSLLGQDLFQWLLDRWDISGPVSQVVLTMAPGAMVTLKVTRAVDSSVALAALQDLATIYDLMPRSPHADPPSEP